MASISRAALLVNAQSRKGASAFDDAAAALRGFGIAVDCYPVTDPAQLDSVVREAIASKPDVLILGGGDGTISGLVDHLVGSGVPLGLLPLGTANSFARSLGIPLDPAEAIKVIAGGHRRRIDLGMIDHDYFANFAAIGMSPLIAESIPHGVKKWGGRLGYIAWAAVQAVRFRPFRLTLSVDGAPAVMLDALEVRIANGSFQGGTELVENAEVDSGEIVVQVVEGRTQGRLALSWLFSLLRLPIVRSTTREFHGRVIRIESVPPEPISIDGEVLARTPVTAKVAPHIIEVFVPAPPGAPVAMG